MVGNIWLVIDNLFLLFFYNLKKVIYELNLELSYKQECFLCWEFNIFGDFIVEVIFFLVRIYQQMIYVKGGLLCIFMYFLCCKFELNFVVFICLFIIFEVV